MFFVIVAVVVVVVIIIIVFVVMVVDVVVVVVVIVVVIVVVVFELVVSPGSIKPFPLIFVIILPTGCNGIAMQFTGIHPKKRKCQPAC